MSVHDRMSERLAWTVVRAGQRGMDDWRRTGTCYGGNAKRRRRGRLQPRQWRRGSPECLGWEGGGERTGMPPPNANTHTHIHDQHKTNTAESHAIKHAHQQDTCRQSHTPGGVCAWVGGWVGR